MISLLFRFLFEAPELCSSEEPNSNSLDTCGLIKVNQGKSIFAILVTRCRRANEEALARPCRGRTLAPVLGFLDLLNLRDPIQPKC